MFVRIIYNKTQLETTYECKKVSYAPYNIEIDPALTKGLLVFDGGAAEEQSLEIDSSQDVEVIYMNNSGKTIDRKIFN